MSIQLARQRNVIKVATLVGFMVCCFIHDMAFVFQQMRRSYPSQAPHQPDFCKELYFDTKGSAGSMEETVHISENDVGNGDIPTLEFPCLSDVAPH